MSTREVREMVAAAIRDAGVLPDGWVVYASPPRTPLIPCVVVGARNPYRTLETFTRERVGLRVSVLMSIDAGLDGLDTVLDVIVPVLWDVETVGIDQVTDVGTVEGHESGPPYLSAGIDMWVI